MPIMFMRRYTRAFIQSRRDLAFVFGDNVARVGYGGQAKEARGECNAIGIATKYTPKHPFKEADWAREPTIASAIYDDFFDVVLALHRGCIVVWPYDGIGTGLADLGRNCPSALNFISQLHEGLRKEFGEVKELPPLGGVKVPYKAHEETYVLPPSNPLRSPEP